MATKKPQRVSQSQPIPKIMTVQLYCTAITAQAERYNFKLYDLQITEVAAGYAATAIIEGLRHELPSGSHFEDLVDIERLLSVYFEILNRNRIVSGERQRK